MNNRDHGGSVAAIWSCWLPFGDLDRDGSVSVILIMMALID
jgi:hypothetical protein